MEYVSGCTIGSSTTDSSVILDGTIDGDGQDDGSGGLSDGLSHSRPTAPDCAWSTIGVGRCDRRLPPLPPEAAPVVTMADVAEFAPAFGAAVGEPNGWAIVGLPVNLVGPSAPITVGASLFGAAAEVRFTPVSWRWDHGDGSTAVYEVPGATWSRSGLVEFSTTATSHVFRVDGMRRVSLSVLVVADYRIAGGPWEPVAGALTLPVAGFDVVVASADTVLVDRDCRAAPAGPGC